jgi:hypothetical protein
MDVRVDEPGNRRQSLPVDLDRSAIAIICTDDPVAADRDIPAADFARADVQDVDVLYDEIRPGSGRAPGR